MDRPILITRLKGECIIDIATSGYNSVALTKEGKVCNDKRNNTLDHHELNIFFLFNLDIYMGMHGIREFIPFL